MRRLGLGLGIGAGNVGGPPTAPAAFTVGQWSLADSPSAGGDTLTVNLFSAPGSGGSPITSYEYRRNGGAWSTLPGGTALGARNITVLATTLANIELRAVSALGAGLVSDTKAATPSALTAPAQFGTGDWSVVDAVTGGDINITITALPNNGGSAITALQYRVDAGSWVSLGSTSTGTYGVSGLTDGVSVSITLRAVNAIGNGTASAGKSVTPTSVSGVQFGAKTKSGAGGVATTGTSITSGNASGHWQIVGAFVVPTATGDTADLNAGPYSLVFNDASTMDISIVANSYSVRTTADVEQAGEDTGLALGDQILFRAGVYDDAGATDRIRRTAAPTGTFNGSNYVVFKPHTGAVVDIKRLVIWGDLSPSVYFEFTGFRFVATNASNTAAPISVISNVGYLYIHDNTSNTPDPGETNTGGLSPYIYIPANSGAGNIRIENNTFDVCASGIIVSGDDCVIKGNDIRRAYIDHVKLIPPIRRLQVIGNVLTDKKAGFTPYTITAITRGNPTLVTVTDATGVVAADDVIFNGLTGCEGLLGSKYNISNVAGNVLTVDVNSTGFTPWVSGGEARISSVHGDFLQTSGAGATDGQLDDIVIRGNRISRGAGSPADIDGQAIFLEDNGAGVYYRNLIVEGNICEVTMTNAMSIQNPLNAIIRNNVVIRKLGHSGPSGTTRITLEGNGTGNSCTDNVSNAFNFDPGITSTNLNNHTIAYDSSAYAAAFVSPLTGEASSDVAVAYAPKVGGVLEVATPDIGAVPHQSFVSPWTYTNPRGIPTIASTSPADNATNVAITTSPTVTFSEPVQFGTGLITLRQNISGVWSDLETFDVVTEVGTGNGQVNISGTVLTINPTASLTNSREYAIRIAATAIDDLSSNSFAGVANDVDISFSTEAAIVFHTQSGTGPYFLDPIDPGADWERLEFKIKIKPNANPGTICKLFAQESVGCDLEILTSGNMRLNVENGAGTVVVSNQTASTGITLNVWQEIALDVDQVAGTANLTKDGSNILSRSWTPSGTTDFFQPTRQISFCGTQAGGNLLPSGWEVEFMEVYKTVLGVRTLHKRIEGNAATVNADGWKLGTNAT